MLLVFILSGVLSSVAPLLNLPTASAAPADDYVFDTPNDPGSLAALKQSVDDQNDAEKSSAFSKTAVYVKGGVFGSTPFVLKINPGRSGCAQAASLSFGGCSGDHGGGDHFGGQDGALYVYSNSYTCVAGKGVVADAAGAESWTVDFDVSMKLNKSSESDAPLFNNTTRALNNTAKLHWVGFGSTQSAGVKHNPAQSGNGTAAASPNDSSINSVPDNCLPPGIPHDIATSGSNDTELDNKGIVNYRIPVLPQASAAVKAAFKAGTSAPGGTASAGGDSATANKDLSCTVWSGSPLNWLICPIIDLLVKAVSAIDGIITSQMTIETKDIFCTGADTCRAYYTAWQSFRNISLGLITIAGLIIVISQALGIELLDAYMIRKTLPRILIASIGITLSWPIMQYLVTLSNDLGFGIRHLIYAPFSQLDDNIDFGFGGILTTLFGTAATGVSAVAAVPLWVEFGGLGALLSFAGTAGLAVLVAVLVLILRQIVIIMLIILAPLAIVCYILPNTQRVYKFWWEAFSKALLMFPLISAFIASGRVFSSIAISNGGPVNGLIGFGAYFAPYFSLPATFRLSGGIMSGVGGLVNKRAQGGFEALRGVRKGEREKRHKAARTGGLYRNEFGRFGKKDPKTGVRKHTASSLLNTITNQSIDAQDGWRIAAARRGGKVGKAIFGRQARGLMGKIEAARIEHTTNAAKHLGLRYHAGRALAGQHQYYADKLDTKPMIGEDGQVMKYANGEEMTAADALRDKFGVGERDSDGRLTKEAHAAAGGEWRGPQGEKEINQLASIYDHGDAGAREAAGELRAKAIEIDSFKGAGNEETQRTDTEFLGMMVAAQAGRLENHELATYYNKLSGHGDPEEATKRLERLQELAAPLRTSQKRGYGIGFKEEGGKKVAYDVYADPAGDAAQASVGRVPADEIARGKAEDLLDKDGDLSAWSHALIAQASDYKMRTYTNPTTGKTEVREWVNPDTGEPELKTGNDKLKADSMKAKLKQMNMYAQGDVGLGAAVTKVMNAAGVEPYDRMGTPPRLDLVTPAAPPPPPEEG